MKRFFYKKERGIANIFLLLGMLVVAVSLPVATKLVQQNQENRSQAALVEDAGVAGTIKCRIGTSSYNPGFKFCSSANGGEIRTCGSNGQWTSSRCPNGCTVGKTYCNPVCTANTYKCDGRNLMICKSDGSGWNLSKECGIDQTCNATTKTCNAKVVVCTGWSTGAWGNCINGTQTRTVTATPVGCTSGTPANKPAISQSCTTPPTCSSTNCGACNQAQCGIAGCRWAGGACMPAAQTPVVTTCKDGTGKTYNVGIKSCGIYNDTKNNLYTCLSNGSWSNPQTCPNGCENGACKAAPKPAQCGSYNNTNVTIYPNGTEACISGSITWVDQVASDNTYNWKCVGVGSGNEVTCSANKIINGVCGLKNNSCVGGRLTDLTDTDTEYAWRCVGVNGGSSLDCKLQRLSAAAVTGLVSFKFQAELQRVQLET